jgi:hypothetical protein
LFSLLSDVCNRRKYCDSKKTDLEILMDLHIFSTPEYEVVFGMLPVCMCTSLVSERLEGFYFYSVFRSLSILGQCLVNINILAPKIGALHRGLQAQNTDFLKNESNNFV